MRRVLGAWLALLLCATMGRAQDLGAEFTVATGASEYALAADEKGGFLVAWTDVAGDEVKRVHARRYAPSGAPLGDSIVLGRAHGGEAKFLAAATVGVGSYIVAWNRLEKGIDHNVARRIDAQGASRVFRFGVTGTALSIAGIGGGEWASGVAYPRATTGFGFGGIWVKLHSATGAVRRTFRVTSGGFAVALAANTAGSFLVVHRIARPAQPEAIRAHLYDASGERLATSKVTSTDDDISASPFVAASGSGRFVVGWIEREPIRLRFYRSLATPIGASIDTSLEANAASVAMDPAGTVLVAFSAGSDCCELFPLMGQRFEPDGTPTGSAFQLSLGDRPPLAAALGKDRFVVVWRDGDTLRGRLVRW